MIQVFLRSPFFYVLWLLVLILSACCLYFFDAHQIQIYINSRHHSSLDFLFFYASFLGEGIILSLVLLFALFQSKSHFFSLLTGWGSAVLFTQLMKNTLFKSYARPGKVFQDFPDWHWVEGITNHHFGSFPSGHTTDIFALMTLMALWTRNKLWASLCFIVALCIGFSRIYLSQHFLPDVMVGSVVGVCFASLAVYIFFYSPFYQRKKSFFDKKWINLPNE